MVCVGASTRSPERPLIMTPLVERVGEARFVALGEASHDTHEFYRERAEITTGLITEKAFAAVAVEADWPDAYHITPYVRVVGDRQSAVDALVGFRRFATWRWRNVDVLHFLKWLRAHNDALSHEAQRVGFYGTARALRRMGVRTCAGNVPFGALRGPT